MYYPHGLSQVSRNTVNTSLLESVITRIKKDIERPNYMFRGQAFTELGDYYLQQKQYLFAVAIYNYVLNIYSLKVSEENILLKQQEIVLKIVDVENQFINQLGILIKRKINLNSYSYLETNLIHKEILRKIRQECKEQLQQIDQEFPVNIYNYNGKEDENEKRLLQLKKAEAICYLYRIIAEKLKNLIRNLLQECITSLGAPPCSYAIICLGSLARGEATPYSDLEFAILVEQDKEEAKEYFRTLTNLLYLKVINLGETILPSMAIPVLNNFYSSNPLDDWFHDDITPRGFAFDGAMPQACKTPLGKKDASGNIIYELIQTPDTMAQFQRDEWYSKENQLSGILTNCSLIMGEMALLEDYKRKINTILSCVAPEKVMPERENNGERNSFVNPMRVTRALKSLYKSGEDYSIKLGFSYQDGKLYDVKKEIYRFIDRTLEDLAQYWGLDSQNSWARIEEMYNKGIINKCAHDNLKIAASISMELRLRTYLANNGQKENMSYIKYVSYESEEEKILKAFMLQDRQVLYTYYYVIVPFSEAIGKFHYWKTVGEERAEVQFSEEIQEKIAMNMSLGKDTGIAFFQDNNFFDASYKTQGLIHQKLMLYSRAEECFEKWADVEPHNIFAIHNLGNIKYTLGKVYEWKMLHEKMLLLLEKQDLNQKDMLSLLENVGCVYIVMGDYEKALQMFFKLLQSLSLGSHNQYLSGTILSHIGTAYWRLGNYQEAIAYNLKALQAAKSACTHESKFILASILNNLGCIYLGDSQHQSAFKCHIESLNYKKALYGEQANHHIAQSYSNIADVLSESSGYDEDAINYYKYSLMMLEKVFGKIDHPDIATGLDNLGNSLIKTGAFDKGYQFLVSALEMRKRIYGFIHPHVAHSLENMGNALFTRACELGDAGISKGEVVAKHQEALNLNQQALYVKTLCFSGTWTLDVALSFSNMGAKLNEFKEYEKALAYHMAALDIWRKLLNNKAHSDIAKSFLNLGVVWNNYRCFEGALYYFQKSYKVYQTLFGNEHPDTIDVGYKLLLLQMRGISLTPESLKKFKEKRKFIRKSMLSVLEKDFKTIELKYSSHFTANSPYPQPAILFNNIISNEFEKVQPIIPKGNYLKRESLLLTDELRQKVTALLPSNFALGSALGKGDCFFDAMAQGLNQLNNKAEYTAKSLRLYCDEYVKSGKHPWVKEALMRDERGEAGYNSYLVSIAFTAEEMEAHERNQILRGSAIWGRPEIEGRIFCEAYGIKLHLIEIHEQAIEGISITEQLVDADGSHSIETMNQEAYKEPKVIHLIVHKNHFVPIIKAQINNSLLTTVNDVSPEMSISTGAASVTQPRVPSSLENSIENRNINQEKGSSTSKLEKAIAPSLEGKVVAENSSCLNRSEDNASILTSSQDSPSIVSSAANLVSSHSSIFSSSKENQAEHSQKDDNEEDEDLKLAIQLSLGK